jgi:outer membrane protein assembly factor BamB
VYVVGGSGDVTCLEAATGKTVWHTNLRTNFGGGLPGWGYSESPLITGDMVIVTPGGSKGTLVGAEQDDGRNDLASAGVEEGAHHSSAILADIAGSRQIVQFSSGSVFGVSLQDGKYLWQYKAPATAPRTAAPIVEGDYVFASSAYGTGGGLAHITGGGDTPLVEEVYFEKKTACHHGGIVKVGEYLIATAAALLICMNFKTGKIAWQARSVGKGAAVGRRRFAVSAQRKPRSGDRRSDAGRVSRTGPLQDQSAWSPQLGASGGRGRQAAAAGPGMARAYDIRASSFFTARSANRSGLNWPSAEFGRRGSGRRGFGRRGFGRRGFGRRGFGRAHRAGGNVLTFLTACCFDRWAVTPYDGSRPITRGLVDGRSCVDARGKVVPFLS